MAAAFFLLYPSVLGTGSQWKNINMNINAVLWGPT